MFKKQLKAWHLILAMLGGCFLGQWAAAGSLFMAGHKVETVQQAVYLPKGVLGVIQLLYKR
jgi:hypothetical protein